MFAYCSDLEAWTFQWLEGEGVTMEDADPCDWTARSTKTDTFDLTETASGTWYIQDEYQRVVVLDPFYLQCVDCQESGDGDECSGRGACDEAVCLCEDGWYGLKCEVSLWRALNRRCSTGGSSFLQYVCFGP